VLLPWLGPWVRSVWHGGPHPYGPGVTVIVSTHAASSNKKYDLLQIDHPIYPPDYTNAFGKKGSSIR
jgi:hypothetical protein